MHSQLASKLCGHELGYGVVFVLSLFFLGGEVIHDFAFALLIGIIVGTYSSAFVASPIVVEWHNRRAAKEAQNRNAA